jgi:hypothetical protein
MIYWVPFDIERGLERTLGMEVAKQLMAQDALASCPRRATLPAPPARS